MGLTGILFSGVLTAVGFLLILGKCSSKLLKRFLGYDWLIDIIGDIGIAVYFGMTGTISGLLIGAVTGICFSVILWMAKNIVGYQTYEKVNGKRQWVEHEPKWDSEYFGNLAARSLASAKSSVNSVFAGFTSGLKQQHAVAA